MRATRSLSVILLLLLAICLQMRITSMRAAIPSSWPLAEHDPQATNLNGDESLLGRQDVGTIRQVWAQPGVFRAVATADRVYALAGRSLTSERVLAIDAATGRIVRSWTLAALGLTSRDYLVDLGLTGGRLVVAAINTVLAVDLRTNRVAWRVAGGATFLTIDGNIVYTGKGCQSACGQLLSMAIDVQSGRVRWRHPGNFGGPPVVIAGHLFQPWGEYQGQTRVYDGPSGSLLATLPELGSWTGDSRTAFVDVTPFPTGRAWLARIAPNGKPVWRLDLGHPSSDEPVYGYGSLVVPSNRFHPGIVCVNARTGKLQWAADLGPGLWLSAANHLLFAVHEASGVLDVLNMNSGAPLLHLRMAGYAERGQPGMAVAGGTVYIYNGASLLALRPTR